MSVFEPITLTYDGEDYRIPASRVMGAIARVEEHVTLTELATWGSDRAKIRVTKLAAAYGSLLRYAGADITDETAYAYLFADAAGLSGVVTVAQTLMIMMVPPSALAAKPVAAKKKPTSNSSGKRTSSSSAKGG